MSIERRDPDDEDPLDALRRKARGPVGELGPEDVFPLVHAADPAAATTALKELSGAWPRCPCFPKIPMGSWADAVCALIEGGVRGLIDFSRGDRDLMRLACGTLGSVGSAEAAAATEVNAALEGLVELESLGAERVPVLAAFEDVLFPRWADVEPGVAKRVRDLLHTRTTGAVNEDELYLATDVLRYVGDATSIALLESYVPSSSAEVDEARWRRTRRSIIAEIRKRNRKRRE